MHFLFLNFLQKVWDFVLYSSRIKKAEVFTITMGDILIFIIWVAILYFVILVLLKRILRKTIRRFTSAQVDNMAIANVISLVLFIISFLILISFHGIDLTALGVFGGLLGVGIGFGIQNIANNFISGIIIFFEKPIKRGDRIQIDGLEGNIKRVSFRATAIRTNDNFTIIVPNSYILQNKIINWSHSDSRVRLHLPIGIGYREDLNKVKEIMLQVANENSHVLKEPLSDVIFENIGASALNLTLRIWTEKYTSNPIDLKSELYFAVYTRLKDNDVEMAYPQLDIWFRDKWMEDY
ncbi:MAG: mechanosensitive ion channel domain-containing protein, partial [Ginsengibacter sp.]